MRKLLTILTIFFMSEKCSAQFHMYANSLLISGSTLIEKAGVISYEMYKAPNATNYYVSSSGNDANSGTSPSFPWRTLPKVNTATYATGHINVFFNRNESWFGSLIVSRNDISFDAYGTGAKPIITGFVTATSWVSAGSGIWSTVVDRAQPNLNMVTINGVPQQIARYPNSDAPNGGYLPYTGGIGLNKIYGVLTTGNVGKKGIVKKQNYREENVVFIAQGHDTVTLAKGEQLTDGGSSPQEAVGAGRGYFYYGSLSYVDKYGEWYFDSATKTLSVHLGSTNPSALTIKISVVDSIINIGMHSNVSISNFSLEGGNTFGIVGGNSSSAYISITDCDLNDIGAKGINLTSIYGVSVLRNTLDWCLSTGIDINSLSGSNNNVTISYNTVTNTGKYDGMFCKFKPSDGSAMSVSGVDSVLVSHNVMTWMAMDALTFGGGRAAGGFIIEYNVCDSGENWLKDHGLLYTVNGPTSLSRNTTIRYNFISNSIGYSPATSTSANAGSLIYLDNATGYCNIYGNVLSNASRSALSTNDGFDNVFRNNLIYNCAFGVRASHLGARDSIHLVDTGNIYYNFPTNNVNQFYFVCYLNGKTIQREVAGIGTIDYNKYSRANDPVWRVEAYLSLGGSGVPWLPTDLINFQNDFSQDTHSTDIDDYTIGNTKLVTNTTDFTVIEQLTQSWTVVGGAVTANTGSITKPPHSGFVLINPQPITGISTQSVRGFKARNYN